MKPRWVSIRPVAAAHSPMLRVTNVNTESPWIQLNPPGLISRTKNELRTVQYIATTHTRPTTRCDRSPFVDRRRFTAPSARARDAPSAWAAINGLMISVVAAQAGRRVRHLDDGRLHPVR